MFHYFLLVCSLLTFLVSSNPLSISNAKNWTFSEIPPSKNIVWYSCFDGFFCALLDVPLDYQNLKGHRAYVPIIKYPATKKPYKGMILTNPGGPGVSGVNFVLDEGQRLAEVAGTNYDIMSWEPRGVGRSVPSANCEELWEGLGKRFLVSEIQGPEFPLSYAAPSLQAAIEKGNYCKSVIGADDQAGPHMTTAITARDMISILDAYAMTKDGKIVKNPSILNYWGISYGTHLGQTFSSMFPDRIGRVLIDAVVDPDDFSAGTWLSSIVDTDKGFSTFFRYCHAAGPSQCSFYTGNTPEDIYNRFQKSIIWALDAPKAQQQNQTEWEAMALTLDILRTYLMAATYNPVAGFPWAARILTSLEAVIEAGITLDAVYDWLFEASDAEGVFKVDDINQINWSLGIGCSDLGNGVTMGNDTDSIIKRLEPLVQKVRKQSYLGSPNTIGSYFGCAGWKIRSNDVYKGPYGGKTRNPILFVNNRFDPVTPLQNAVKGARIFKGAELLTVEAVGHSSLDVKNQCAFKKINTFFQTGKLPGKKDDNCPLEASAWNITLKGGLTKRMDLNGGVLLGLIDDN